MLVPEATSQTAPRIGTDIRASGNRAESPAVAKEQVKKDAESTSRAKEISVENHSDTAGSSRARLNFDAEEHRVFVEILDRNTGEVITRFPPEQIAEHIDEVLEQTDQATNLEDAGLIFDQKA